MWINRCGIGVYYKDEIFGFEERAAVSLTHIELQENPQGSTANSTKHRTSRYINFG